MISERASLQVCDNILSLESGYIILVQYSVGQIAFPACLQMSFPHPLMLSLNNSLPVNLSVPIA